MASKQHTCLILEDDDASREILIQRVEKHGFKSVHCKGLYTCEACQFEPDVVVIGEKTSLPLADSEMGNVELMLRECQVPVLSPAKSPIEIVERFDDLHFYKNVDEADDKMLPLVLSHAKRRNIREDMYRSLQGLYHLKEVQFDFKSLEEAQALALLISTLAPSQRLLRLGLTEIFVNAIEHGNLGIGAHTKEQLRENGAWMREVERRLEEPRYRDKTAHISLRKERKRVLLNVEDEGEGFEWLPYFEAPLDMKEKKKSGRGIAIARKAGFHDLQYSARGNEVSLSFEIEAKA